MTNGGPPGVPILGAQKPTKAATAVVALVRKLSDQGVYDLVDGITPREAYLDVEQLLEAVREVVREEFAAALVRWVAMMANASPGGSPVVPPDPGGPF